MSTPPYPPPNPGAIWPPPPTQQPAPEHASARFISLLPLSRAAAILYVLDLISMIGFTLIESRQALPSGALPDLLMVGLVGLLFCTSFAAARVVFLRWTFLAYRNLTAFETSGLETTPGWAAGWFFIPVVNLYRPYMIFHEIWKASAPEADSRDEVAWQQVVSPPLIGAWWASVLGSIFLPFMLSKALTHGLTTVASSALTLILELVSTVFTIAVVSRISRRQEAKARTLAPKPSSYIQEIPHVR